MIYANKAATLFYAAALVCLLFAGGCGKAGEELPKRSVRLDLVPRLLEYEAEYAKDTAMAQADDAVSGDEAPVAGKEQEPVKYPEILCFVDAHGECHEAYIDERVGRHDYDWSCLKNEDGDISYEGDERYRIRKGVDVSSHQGGIDWAKVRADGYDFAFVRMVYRGYGEAGSLNLDARYRQNITNAQAAGLDVGVYVFSQAVNEAEALEEAELVIESLVGLELQLPVVFDPELIMGKKARTNFVTGQQFTKNTIVFCERVREAGFEPMVYANMKWEAFLFDMYELRDYPFWYADYEAIPQTPYAFTFWQCTDKGRVAGIGGNSDIDIWFVPSLDETDVLLDEAEIVGEI